MLDRLGKNFRQKAKSANYMLFLHNFGFVARLLLSTLSLVGVSPAQAEIQSYEFQLAEENVTRGEAVVAVRLVNKLTGQPVPDAIIFAHRLDMTPDGMPTMAAELEPVPSDQPGIYRFKTNFTMEGGWQLSLAAKIQGETGTLQARLVLKAKN